jgi:hypothetical protein
LGNEQKTTSNGRKIGVDVVVEKERIKEKNEQRSTNLSNATDVCLSFYFRSPTSRAAEAKKLRG